MIEIEKLEEGLNNLRGLDYIAAAKEERATGNSNVLLNTDEKFQMRLAAKALGVNHNDLNELPLKQYLKVQQKVFTFLFNTASDDEETSDK